MTQPEALRLDDLLEMGSIWQDQEKAAAELRRLHEENEALREANGAFGKRQEWWNEKMFAIEQQRDALLEALKAFANEIVPNNPNDPIWVNARAAIKQAEGEKE